MTIYRHVRNAEDLHLEVFFHMGGAKCLNSAPLKISKNPPHRAFFGVGV